MGLRFEWDKRKADSNLKKHGFLSRRQHRFLRIRCRSRYRIRIIQHRKHAFST